MVFSSTPTRHSRASAGALRWLAPLVALAIAGCDLPGKPDPRTRAADDRGLVDFEPLYKTHCAGCHGARGKLGPAPPLNDPLFLAIVPDDSLTSVISHGRRGTPMPAFARERGGPLSEKQIRSLADGLKQNWGTHQKPPAAVPGYLPSPRALDNAAQRQRANQLFAAACADCHGAHGQGTDEAGALHDLAFLELTSDQALRRIMITGRPDLGMPNYADPAGRGDDFRPLAEQDLDDLLAMLAAWRRGETFEDH